MGSYDRSQSDRSVGNDREIDWSRYGLGNAERRPSRSESRGHEEFGPEMYQTGTNELFAQEFVSTCSKTNSSSCVHCLVNNLNKIDCRTLTLGGNPTSSYLSQFCLALGMVCLLPV